MSSTPREANWSFVEPVVGLGPALSAAATSFALWLCVCVYSAQSGSGPETSTAGWTVLALVGILVSASLRLFSTAGTSLATTNPGEFANELNPEIVWWLSWIVELNSLGIVAMLSPSLSSGLPTVAVILATEICLWDRMPMSLRVRLEHCFQAVSSTSAISTASTTSANVDSPRNDLVDLASDNSTQSLTAGVTDEGLAFQEGLLSIQLAANQKSDSVAIAFVKAFSGVPTVELEIESNPDEEQLEVDDLSLFDADVELNHVTPSGLRLTVKRHNALSDQSYQVRWYAIEDEHAHNPTQQLLEAKLP